MFWLPFKHHKEIPPQKDEPPIRIFPLRLGHEPRCQLGLSSRGFLKKDWLGEWGFRPQSHFSMTENWNLGIGPPPPNTVQEVIEVLLFRFGGEGLLGASASGSGQVFWVILSQRPLGLQVGGREGDLWHSPV